jgi:hypothetical protein
MTKTTTRKGPTLLLVESRFVSFSEVNCEFKYDLATPRRSDGPEV